jgi:FMN phosphatase YigB (HAD superfamily)
MCFGFVATNLEALAECTLNLVTKNEHHEYSRIHTPLYTISIVVEVDGKEVCNFETSYLDQAVAIVRELQSEQTSLMLRTNSIELAKVFSVKYLRRYENPLYVLDLDKTVLRRNPKSDGPDPDGVYELFKERSRSDDPNHFATKSSVAVMRPDGMVPVENATIPTLEDLQRHFNVIALTSRVPQFMMGITFEQLEHLGIDFSLSSPVKKDFVFPDVGSFTNGAMFLQELQQKGPALALLLERFELVGYKPGSVVFIDDSEKHVASVANAMAGISMPCLSFHYTAALGREQETENKLIILKQFGQMVLTEQLGQDNPEVARILRQGLFAAFGDETAPPSPTRLGRCASVTGGMIPPRPRQPVR